MMGYVSGFGNKMEYGLLHHPGPGEGLKAQISHVITVWQP